MLCGAFNSVKEHVFQHKFNHPFSINSIIFVLLLLNMYGMT